MADLLHIEEASAKSSPLKASFQDFLELGFRPLYLCGATWAVVAVALWVFAPQWLQGSLSGVFWHAHEMLWGFVGAVAVGFLLTATTNWTGKNPLQGKALGGLALVWCIARIGFLFPGDIAFAIACAADLAFFAGAAFALARCLWAHQSKYNYAFPALLLGMGLANAAFLYAIWEQRDYATLMQRLFTGLLCMLVIALLLARRVIPFFAGRAVPGLKLDKHTRSGQWQSALTVLAIACIPLQFNNTAAALFITAGLLTLWHWVAWKPWAVRTTPLLWILYLGYLGMGLGLIATAAYTTGWTTRLSWPVHTIAMAGFGALILGMMTRTALGHTGRALSVDGYMLLSFYLLCIAIVLRIAALSASTSNVAWLHASAACWMLAFAVYLVRFIPILTQPRADKRPGKPISLQRT